MARRILSMKGDLDRAEKQGLQVDSRIWDRLRTACPSLTTVQGPQQGLSSENRATCAEAFTTWATSLKNWVEDAQAEVAALRKQSAPASSSPWLALLNARARPSDSRLYFVVEGQVRNLTNEPLHHMGASVSWLDRNGKFVAAERNLIDYDPILPGQVSPFHVMSSRNPEITGYSLEFVEWIGGTVPWVDQR
jgi:hypothetical protein